MAAIGGAPMGTASSGRSDCKTSEKIGSITPDTDDTIRQRLMEERSTTSEVEAGADRSTEVKSLRQHR